MFSLKGNDPFYLAMAECWERIKEESGGEKNRCEFMRGVRFFKRGSSVSQ
ncbi:hypothetical protein HMPREF1396_00294 [Helicobacter pylori GAM114Ai]|nr:hypothetical protein HMPREF1396_00294 [Helicobacter pylori GAM114Ai]